MSAVERSAVNLRPDSIEEAVGRSWDHLHDVRVQSAVRLGSFVRGVWGEILRRRGFVEIAPVIVAPVTDPLNHPVANPQIDYYGAPYSLTRSMIFHKQLAAAAFDRVFCLSPNVRFEPLDRRTSGRHLVEFVQLDLEVRDASREEVMALAESLLEETVSRARSAGAADTGPLARRPGPLHPPFETVSFTEARRRHGPDFERILSERADAPFWIVDIPLLEREFYDREDPARPGILRDMDLIYPEGYGEGISGGEREHELDRIVRRIHAKGQQPEEFEWYLAAARRGLPRSAGFGIGVERFVRWLGGFSSVAEATLFPKRIGEWSL